jgi:hypothetical protein
VVILLGLIDANFAVVVVGAVAGLAPLVVVALTCVGLIVMLFAVVFVVFWL